MQGKKSKNFTESRAWNEGHKLVLATYRFLRTFPDEEQFSLRNQMQRATVSITTNLAEAHAVSSARDRLKYYTEANIAMIEFQNCLLIARDVGYLKSAYFDEIARQAVSVNKQLAGLLASANKEL